MGAASCHWISLLPWNQNEIAERWEPKMTTGGLAYQRRGSYWRFQGSLVNSEVSTPLFFWLCTNTSTFRGFPRNWKWKLKIIVAQEPEQSTGFFCLFLNNLRGGPLPELAYLLFIPLVFHSESYLAGPLSLVNLSLQLEVSSPLLPELQLTYLWLTFTFPSCQLYEDVTYTQV